jgi:hypothetical protein
MSLKIASLLLGLALATVALAENLATAIDSGGGRSGGGDEVSENA